MFHLLNTIANAWQLSKGLDQLQQVTVPYLNAAWQFITAKKTRQILRAIGVALWVLGTIVLAGVLEVGKLAVQEAVIAFQKQFTVEATCSEPQELQDSKTAPPTVQPMEVLALSGIRELRQLATQRGIRNAGRMRKPELLASLNTTSGS